MIKASVYTVEEGLSFTNPKIHYEIHIGEFKTKKGAEKYLEFLTKKRKQRK